MSDTFCILPWIHMTLTPGGFVRLCCQDWGYVSKNQVPMSAYKYTIEEIWNSDYMCAVRNKMLEGKEVNACRACYTNEAQLMASYRIYSNNEWNDKIGSFDKLIASSKKNSYKVLKPPISFHLIPGTLCNLKCRMCSTLFSSQIQRDPVHALWCPPKQFLEPEVMQWKAGKTSIGPEPIVGVDTRGFFEPEIHENRLLRWTQGVTSLSFIVPQNLTLQKLKIKIWEHHPRKYSLARKLWLRLQRKAFKGHNLKVLINDHQLLDDEMANGVWERNFDLSTRLYNGPITIQLISDTFRVPLDSRQLGIALESVEVTCAENVQTRQPLDISDSSSSLPSNPWYEQTEWVLKELIKEPNSLRELQFSGGEPMIQGQVEDIIDFCNDQQIAENVGLQFNINCTVLHERMLKKLGQFKKTFMGLSIDAYGPYWEYIRYPGKWDHVAKNIVKIKKLANAFVVFTPVLQIYNVLNIVELLRYADLMGLDCWITPLTAPWFLCVSVLPAKARNLASKRLREYAQHECRPGNSDSAVKIADFLDAVKDNCSPESLRTFMLFTNDLDATRNQSFQEIHSELLGLIEETGFRWSDERRFT